MRVDVVDPSAYTPPYDHALCAALARAGADVRLVTSAFVHGAVPRPEGYAVDERFYRGVPAAATSGKPPTELSSSGRPSPSAAYSTPDWSISR